MSVRWTLKWWPLIVAYTRMTIGTVNFYLHPYYETSFRRVGFLDQMTPTYFQQEWVKGHLKKMVREQGSPLKSKV